jgi:hypothetical protein
MSTWLAWLLFLPPWLLLVFLEPERKRRFIPVALLACLFSTVTFQMAVKLDWWSVTSNIFYFTQISAFVYGFLPVAALISFYWTYPNLWLYFGLNLSIDAIQAYVISRHVFEKAGFYQLTGMSRGGLFMLETVISVLLYLFQVWLERGRQGEGDEVPMERWLRRWSFRAKAR